MRTVLIDIDTQFDFCDPAGAYPIGGASDIVVNVSRLVTRAVEREAPILGSIDSHDFDSWQFAGAQKPGPHGENPNYPRHGIKGTLGWLKVTGSLAPHFRYVPNVVVGHEDLSSLLFAGQVQQVLFEKEGLSLFDNPNVSRALDLVAGTESVRFVIMGVALDLCVRSTALGLVHWQFRRTEGQSEVWIVSDATKPMHPGDADAARQECQDRGVQFASTEQALAMF